MSKAGAKAFMSIYKILEYLPSVRKQGNQGDIGEIEAVLITQ